MATLIGPVLGSLGVIPLAAHLFIFYFGMMSMVTPPVALAAYAASSIAGTSIMPTAFAAFRFALVGFTLPYMFIYRPELLMLDANGEAASCDGDRRRHSSWPRSACHVFCGRDRGAAEESAWPRAAGSRSSEPPRSCSPLVPRWLSPGFPSRCSTSRVSSCSPGSSSPIADRPSTAPDAVRAASCASHPRCGPGRIGRK